MGDATGTMRHHRAFREGLHPDATELRLTLFEGRADGRRLVETTVPITERVQAGELEAEVVSHSPSLSAATHACLECGRRGDQWICSECKVNGLALAARRSGQLVPQAIVSIPGALDSASGLRQAVAGILAWENTFVLRLVFEPSAPNDAHRFHDPPGPVVGRWTAEDATGRAFVGARRRWGFTQSGGRALGDAEIEFMPELEPGSRTVLVRRESPDGRVLLELELPLDPSA